MFQCHSKLFVLIKWLQVTWHAILSRGLNHGLKLLRFWEYHQKSKWDNVKINNSRYINLRTPQNRKKKRILCMMSIWNGGGTHLHGRYTVNLDQILTYIYIWANGRDKQNKASTYITTNLKSIATEFTNSFFLQPSSFLIFE